MGQWHLTPRWAPTASVQMCINRNWRRSCGNSAMRLLAYRWRIKRQPWTSLNPRRDAIALCYGLGIIVKRKSSQKLLNPNLTLMNSISSFLIPHHEFSAPERTTLTLRSLDEVENVFTMPALSSNTSEVTPSIFVWSLHNSFIELSIILFSPLSAFPMTRL